MKPWDTCEECGVRVLTMANNNRIVDQKALAPKYIPKGGCQCPDSGENPGCQVCFASQFWCHNHSPEVHGSFSLDPGGQLKLQLGDAA